MNNILKVVSGRKEIFMGIDIHEHTYRESNVGGYFNVTSYPTIFRRRLIDFACKIIATSREVTLNVTRMIWETLRIEVVWERCNNPEPIRLQSV